MPKMAIPDIGNVKPPVKGSGGSTGGGSAGGGGGGGGGGGLGAPVPKPIAPTAYRPEPIASGYNSNPYLTPEGGSSGGGYDLGGGGGGGGALPDMGGQISDVDYLAGDSGYQAQVAALMKALSDYRADTTAQGSRYDTDYGKGLKALGWNDLDGDFATAEGEWDLNDPNTAAGRGFTGQRNDFASRGMLQSSDYGRANDLLMRNLNDQRGSMETGRNRFTQDLASQLSAFETENNAAQQAAKQEALLRRAAPYMSL